MVDEKDTKVVPVVPKTDVVASPAVGPAESVKSQVPVKPVSTPKKATTAKIKLFKNHIHSGILYRAGTEIEVDETSLRWIEDHQIGARV